MMDLTEGSKDDGLRLSEEMFSFTPPALKKLQEKQAKAAKAGKPVPTIDSLPEMPVGKAVPADETLVLTNTSDKALKYRFETCQLREFTIAFKPSNGTLKPKKSVRVTAKLTVHVRVNTNYRLTLKVNDGTSSHFITAKIRCETGVFGVDPSTLEMCDDSFDEGGKTWHIPVILKNLKDCLIAAGGLKSEGVFRLAGELTVLKSTKEQINRASATNSGPGCIVGECGGLPDDVNNLATLIKIWYRELPQLILNSLPTKDIVDSSEVDDCVAAATKLPQLQRDLLDWILELLLRVAANRATTKMTAQNLAIVVAPNLYEATTPDPVQGLIMSQKAVGFVHNILVYMVREREKATGTKLDTELHKKDLKHTPCSAFTSKGPIEQPVSTPSVSHDDLPLPEDDDETSKKNEDKKPEVKGEKKKKEHHHHHQKQHRHKHEREKTKKEDPKEGPKEDDKPKEEPSKDKEKPAEEKNPNECDAAVVSTEPVPIIVSDFSSEGCLKPSHSHDDRSRRSSHADRSRKESHADLSRRDSHADRSRRSSHADRSRKGSHADLSRRDSHADRSRKSSHADRSRRESHADRSRRESHADRSRKESHADRSRKDSHADKSREDSHADVSREDGDNSGKECRADDSHEDSHADNSGKDSHADNSHEDSHVDENEKQIKEESSSSPNKNDDEQKQ